MRRICNIFNSTKNLNICRFLILELCAGTLEDFLRDKFPGLEPNELRWLYQMAAGVNYIHSRNMVHRDIKPDNILLYGAIDDVNLKISDFGYSKRTTERGSYSLSSGVKGTLNYLAPELMNFIDDNEVNLKRRATTASDVFALGCTFLRFLAKGAHPFGNGPHIMSNIANGKSDLSSEFIKP